MKTFPPWFLCLLLFACRPSEHRTEGNTTDSAPSATSTASAVAAPRPPLPAKDAGLAVVSGVVEPGPYSPPQEESVTAPIDPVDAGAKRPIGTFEDWVAAYQGSGQAETQKPPRLGVLADLPQLPKSKLVFVRSAQIVRVDLPSGKETPLTQGSSASVAPHWVQGGRALFFLSNREGSVDKVFRMQADGTGPKAVTKALRAKYDGVIWAVSDNGAYVVYLGGPEFEGQELHVVDVANGKDEIIHRGDYLEDMSFSKDNKTLFVVEGWNTRLDRKIVAIDLTTRQAKTLPRLGHMQVQDNYDGSLHDAAGVGEIDKPRDMGDGRLLFSASGDFSMGGRRPRLYTMPIGGGAWSALSDFAVPIGFLNATPSPDGTTLALAWSTREGGFGADWRQEVSVMPSSGASSPKALTTAFPRPFYSAASPAWAPDNRHLAFVLSLCPYVGCEPTISSVVLVDTRAATPKLVFVGYGGSPAFSNAD